MPRDLPAILAALDHVDPLIRQHADEADRSGRYPAVLTDALFEAGLFRLWIPTAYGGDELPLPAALEVFEAASRIDGAAGWLVTIGTGGALFAATMHPPFAAEVYGPGRALIAGSGKASGRATPVPGGYRVSGRWRYASGAHQASWYTANCVIEDGDATTPRIRAMAFPPDHVQVVETWDTVGMRATESHDILVEDEFVPEEHSFDVFGPRFEDGALYRVPFAAMASLSFGAVALGIARHAIEAFPLTVAPERLERPEVTAMLDEVEDALHTAHASFHAEAAKTWRATVAQEEPVDEGRRAAFAAAHAASSAAEVTERLFLAVGMAALPMASEFNRCWRDVHTVAQHAALSRISGD